MSYVIKIHVHTPGGLGVAFLADNNGWYAATNSAQKFSTINQARAYMRGPQAPRPPKNWCGSPIIVGPRKGEYSL